MAGDAAATAFKVLGYALFTTLGSKLYSSNNLLHCFTSQAIIMFYASSASVPKGVHFRLSINGVLKLNNVMCTSFDQQKTKKSRRYGKIHAALRETIETICVDYLNRLWRNNFCEIPPK